MHGVSCSRLYQRALEICKTVYGVDHPRTLMIRSNLAGIYMETKQFEKAEALLRQLLIPVQRNQGTEHPEVGRLYANLATVYASQGKFTEAGPLFVRALEIYQKSLGPEHPQVTHIKETYAKMLRETQQTEENFEGEVETTLRSAEAVQVARQMEQEGHKMVRSGAWQRGLARLREAQALYQKIGDVRGQATVSLEIGEVHQRFGDYEIAHGDYRDAERFYRQIGDRTGQALAGMNIGMVEIQLSHPEAAISRLKAAAAYFHDHGEVERAKVCDKLLSLIPTMEMTFA